MSNKTSRSLQSLNSGDFSPASSRTSKRGGEIQRGKIFRLTQIFLNRLLKNVHPSNTNPAVVLRGCATEQQLIGGFSLLRPRSTSGQSLWDAKCEEK